MNHSRSDLVDVPNLDSNNMPSRNFAAQLLAGVLALISALVIAIVIHRIQDNWGGIPEKAVGIKVLVLAILGGLSITLYLLAKWRMLRPAEFGLLIIGTCSVLLIACYFFLASFYIFLPADILIWSEGDFVNDILKFRQGYSLFTAEANNESFTYVPGSQLLTYFFAWVIGEPTSIPVYRSIQVIYTLFSAVFAFLACRRIFRTCFPAHRETADSPLWGIVWLTGFFLLATNSITNPFTHLLHGDALAQLVTVFAFWLLIEYEVTKKQWVLLLMVLIPAVGFWVKQSLIIWAALYPFYLLFFDSPRSITRTLLFGAASGTGVMISIGIGYTLWQENFTYWIFTVLGAHGVSPLRSVQHLFDIWIYVAAGLAGGMILLNGTGFKKLVGPWLVWLVLIATETYTSGVAWMLNHIGPGSLIAGIWFFAALAGLWQRFSNEKFKDLQITERILPLFGAVVVCLMFSGFGFIRVPSPPFGEDSGRYIKQIENEFSGQDRQRVLLDVGTWVYLDDGVVMKDRAPSIGERGYSQTGDFSGILHRLDQKYYSKILVRNLHSPDFWYDHSMWTKSSNIRPALLRNYKEIGKIKAVEGIDPNSLPYAFNEISILVPSGE